MIVAVDAAQLKAVVFDRVAVDTAGQLIRDVLEAAVAEVPAVERIVDAQKLSTVRPVAPFLALRRGPIPTIERSIAAATFYWFLYDEPGHSYLDSNTMVKRFAQAYNYKSHPLIYNGSQLGEVALLIGEETTDRALGGLLVTKLTLTVYC
jgi:hypothetical protein